MHIDKFKQSDGWYKDADGVDYEHPLDLLGEMLGFCGCGCPDEALRFVGKVLRLIKNLNDQEEYNKESWSAVRGFPEDDGTRYFVWYVLTDKGFLEHGTSVPGWLTDKGIELLEDIEELNTEHT